MTKCMALKKVRFSTRIIKECVIRLYIFSVGIIYQQQNSVHKHVDPAGGALEELQRIIGIIRAEWKETQIIVRGDSAYAREDKLSTL